MDNQCIDGYIHPVFHQLTTAGFTSLLGTVQYAPRAETGFKYIRMHAAYAYAKPMGWQTIDSPACCSMLLDDTGKPSQLLTTAAWLDRLHSPLTYPSVLSSVCDVRVTASVQ
jgi:hypothetical protein